MPSLNPYIQTIQNVEPAPSGVSKHQRVVYLRDGITLGGADVLVFTTLEAVQEAETAGTVDATVTEFAASLFGAIDNLTPTGQNLALELAVGKYDSTGSGTPTTALNALVDAGMRDFWAIACDSQALADLAALAGTVHGYRTDSNAPLLCCLFGATNDADYLTATLPASVTSAIDAVPSNKFVPWANLGWSGATSEAVGAFIGRAVCWPLSSTAPAWKGSIFTQTDGVQDLTPAQIATARSNDLNVIGSFFSAAKFAIEGVLVDGRQIGTIQTIDYIDHEVQRLSGEMLIARAAAGKTFPLNALGKGIAKQIVDGVLTSAEAAGHVNPGWETIAGEVDLVNYCIPITANIRPTLEGKPSPITLNVRFREE